MMPYRITIKHPKSGYMKEFKIYTNYEAFSHYIALTHSLRRFNVTIEYSHNGEWIELKEFGYEEQ